MLIVEIEPVRRRWLEPTGERKNHRFEAMPNSATG